MENIITKVLKGKFVLIAEIGVNYYDIAKQNDISPIEAAKLMVIEAKKSGLHAVKFQTYTASKLASKNSPSYWDTKEEKIDSQYELFQKFDKLKFEDYKEISEFCSEHGIEFLSTPFDFDSADYLNDLMSVYKISSSDLNNLPFIEHIAKKGKPIILSTGASTESEIESAVNTIKEYNNESIVLMHCVLEYPTPFEHANLNRITSLKSRFSDVIVGYSDHTKPDESADVIKTAYNLGATIIEKHFTLDKSIPGNDHYHSMDPEDASKIINGIEFIQVLRGSYELNYLESEAKSRLNARRSIVSAVRISKGEYITKDKITFKRPGNGISPDRINEILGRRANIDIEEDTIILNEMLLKK